MILAGDIGGTNTRLACFEEDADRLRLIVDRVYPSHEHEGLGEIVTAFVRETAVTIQKACLGIAGPVLNGRVTTPNLPWVIDSAQLSQELSIPRVWLINDLEAHASGIGDLGPGDLTALNQAIPVEGNAALIAAGTGLGEAGLYWDGARHHPFPCEGGHADFAPRNAMEIALLQYLLKKFGRVSYERLLSGPGLKNIYDFLHETQVEPEPDWLQQELIGSQDPAAVISHYGLEAKAPICERALDLFTGIYGAEAGNLALKFKALHGVFISGGIAAKILPKINSPLFLEAFTAKGRLRPMLEAIPLNVITNNKVGLLGAARYAVERSN
ncbi:MAG TPA: glucokinase [Candidatus Saccharimonadales bacterium]|jgi:glucokinase|nr:glucokinase [Candidatus Saccharimonadales bacterium]